MLAGALGQGMLDAGNGGWRTTTCIHVNDGPVYAIIVAAMHTYHTWPPLTTVNTKHATALGSQSHPYFWPL